MKTKIINILHHAPLPVHFGDIEELKSKTPFEFEIIDAKNWVGFFLGDHHVMTARETLKRSNKYNIECWRPYNNKLKVVHTKEIEGITHRVFPCINFKVPYFGSFLWSESLYQALKREIRRGNIIIHLHDGHSKFINILLNRLKPFNVPIIYQQRSNKFAIFKYRLLPWYKRYNISALIEFYFQKKALKYIDCYLSDSVFERKLFNSIFKHTKFIHYKQGIDSDSFKPAETSIKNDIRKKLGIKNSNFIVLYVGRFYADKDVDILISSFLELKKKIEDITFVFVGGYKTDEFYSAAKSSGILLFERIHETELPSFYQMADLYVMPVKNFTVKYFGGFGNAPIQSLLCNIPIISDNIIHFLGTNEERKLIGRPMISKNILTNNILDIYINRNRFNNCREIAKKYYDIDETMKVLLQNYDRMNSDYFDKELI